MRTFRSIPWIGLFFALVLNGCSASDLAAPSDSAALASGPGSDTFVLTSATDSRIPAPGLETIASTPEDRAFLESLPAVAVTSRAASTSPSVFWNRLTTQLGVAAKQPPPMLARSYALVQVGIYDALVASRDHRRGNLPERSVAAGVASRVLTYLFPGGADQIEAAATEQVALDGGVNRVAAAWSLGSAVGRLVVMRGQRDGSDIPFTGTIPTGDGIWTGTNPVLPMCGSWKTWIIPSGADIQPAPPYAYGSTADLADVQEVLDVSLNRTAEQIAAVHKWGDVSPPAIWNEYLNDRIESQGLGAVEAARAHAYLNVAMADAFICCWATKYTYWTARPFHRTPGLVTVIPTPNFPSYTSGHSTISAAAAAVMGEAFPSERAYFLAESEEAKMSRLWGGIHFRQDNERGAQMGGLIGEMVVGRMSSGRRLAASPGTTLASK